MAAIDSVATTLSRPQGRSYMESRVFRFDAPPPLSLYIHFPWCVRKCPYCDFNSHAVGSAVPEDAYVEALLKDLEQALPAVWGRTVQTLFMGGGTPSLFSPDAIDRLLGGIRARLPLQPGLEISLEANPGTVEQERFSAYRQAGVNRLSLGIQSLNDTHLKALGRIHSSEQAVRAAESARLAGFENLNLDLMFGLPSQTVEQAISDLHAVLNLQPDHLSWYQLTLEPNTLFHAQPPALPDDDLKWEMQQRGQLLLAERDYTQYEVSAFTRNGKPCRHNMNYWRFGDYIGIGAGAHGKITDAAHGVIHRIWKKRSPRDYLASAGTERCIDGSRTLSETDTVFEFALNALRLKQGFRLSEFVSVCGLPEERLLPLLHLAAEDGLLSLHEGDVKHTDRGWRFLNDLIERFLPEEANHAGGDQD